MENKKTKKADLQNKRVLFFEIGLIVALVVSVFAFRWGITEKQMVVIAEPPIEVPPEMLPPTRQDEQQVKTVEMPNINFDVIEIVKNEAHKTIDLGQLFFEPGDDIVLAPVQKRERGLQDTIFIVVEQMPKFMGGNQEDFRRWVLKNVVYPQLAIDNQITGRVVLEFVVEKDGSIGGINVLQSPERVLSEAATKVVASAPKWEPGRQRDMPARVKFTMPVDFRLE